MLDGVRRAIAGTRRSEPNVAPLVSELDRAVTTLVACVGDSITKGSVSSDYVAMLSHRLSASGFAFVNEGVNGNLAWNVGQRLDAVIARRPAVVTLLIGTNDVNATLDEESQRSYRRSQGLPCRASLPWYRENVAAILDRLAAETDARVLVLDIPMLGEDLSSEWNLRVGTHNAALRDICAERGVPCLPLHDRLAGMLPVGHQPPPYTGDRTPIVRAILSHAVLRRSWDDISRRNGLTVLTDHLHLNDRAAAAVTDLVEEALMRGWCPPGSAPRGA
jgi:lysophospholipase L1-like esterase